MTMTVRPTAGGCVLSPTTERCCSASLPPSWGWLDRSDDRHVRSARPRAAKLRPHPRTFGGDRAPAHDRRFHDVYIHSPPPHGSASQAHPFMTTAPAERPRSKSYGQEV